MTIYRGINMYGRTAQSVKNRLEKKGCTVSKIKRTGTTISHKGMHSYAVHYHTKK